MIAGGKMIEVYQNLYIGNQVDYETKVKFQSDWYVVHACKEPYHRQMLGYKGRSAPMDHPEYLFGRRGNRLILNLIDAEDPKYIPKEIINTALEFIDEALYSRHKCLVHCNQGESRAPSIGLLYLMKVGYFTIDDFDIIEREFKRIYNLYSPHSGIRLFSKNYYCSIRKENKQ